MGSGGRGTTGDMSHEPVVVKGNRVPGTSQPMATVRRQLEAALERRARVSDEYKTPVPGLHVAYIREPVTSTPIRAQRRAIRRARPDPVSR